MATVFEIELNDQRRQFEDDLSDMDEDEDYVHIQQVYKF